MEEEPVCRVCRSSHQPLCHPCKCSGSMKYVHQDCLEEWLSHSGKGICEICGHEFSFTPIYADTAPEEISLSVVLGHMFLKYLVNLKKYSRFFLAAVVWLVAIPYYTVWVWRLYFDPGLLYDWVVSNFRSSSNSSFISIWEMSTSQIFHTFFSDVFEGQIISSMIIIICLLAICLKEIIVLNTQGELIPDPPLEPEPAPFVQPVEIPQQPDQPIQHPLDPVLEARVNGERLMFGIQQLQRGNDELGTALSNILNELEEPVPEDPRPPSPQPDQISNGESEEESEVPFSLKGKGRAPEDEFDDFTKFYEKYKDSKEEFYRKRQNLSPDQVFTLRPDNTDESTSSQSSNVKPKYETRLFKPLIPETENQLVGNLAERPALPLPQQFDRPLRRRLPIRNEDIFEQPLNILEPQERLVNFRQNEELQQFIRDPLVQRDIRARLERRVVPIQRERMRAINLRQPAQNLEDEDEQDVNVPQQARMPLNINFNVNVNALGNGIQAEINAQGDVGAFFELVGVQGSLKNLFVTAGIVLLITLLVIGMGAWLPYMTGKLCVVFITDYYFPIIDYCVSSVLSVLHKVGDVILDPIVESVAFLIHLGINQTGIVLKEAATANSTVVPALLEKVVEVVAETTENSTNTLGIFNRSVWKWNSGLSGTNVYSWPWIRIPDRILYVMIGYVCYLGLLWNYYRQGIAHNPYYRSMKRVLMKWSRYTLLGAKFIFFISFELAIFPTICGTLVDLCTLPLFGPNATISARFEFYQTHPFTFWFVHWLVGTAFMFQFAMFVSSIREIVRKGVMWFVRDPNDPQFNPINEILERDILLQLRKLTIGTLIYSSMVFGGVGGFTIMCYVWEFVFGQVLNLANFIGLFSSFGSAEFVPKGMIIGAENGPFRILPLKWEFWYNDSYDFPYSLIFFHFIIPRVVLYFKPKLIFKAFLRMWFVWTAKQLCLTSFLFGGSHPEEESDSEEEVDEVIDDDNDDNWQDEDDNVASIPVKKVHKREFRYLRVPRHDFIEVIPGQRILEPMREGDPIVGRPNETPEEIAERWTSVYVPNRFKLRVFILIMWLWFCQLFISSCLFVFPLVIGRSILFTLNNAYKLVTVTDLEKNDIRLDLPIHDTFAYSLGALLCSFGVGSVYLLYKFSNFMTNLFDAHPREEDETANAYDTRVAEIFVNIVIIKIKDAYGNVGTAFKAIYLGLWFGVVIPVILSLNIKSQLIANDVETVSSFHVLLLEELTSFKMILYHIFHGLIYLRVIYMALRRFALAEFMATFDQTFNRGIRHVPLLQVTRKYILPVAGFFLVGVWAPIISKTAGEVLLQLHATYGWKLAYSLLCIIPLIIYLVIHNAPAIFNSWVNRVRDERYLVGRTLRNIE